MTGADEWWAQRAAEAARRWGDREGERTGAAAIERVREAGRAPEASQPSRRLLVLVAAAVGLLIAGGVALLTTVDGESDRIVPATSPLEETTIASAPTDVTTTPDGLPADFTTPPSEPPPAPSGPEIAEPATPVLPFLPDSLTERWTTTIDGQYPQSTVRIGDVIAFGQQDDAAVRATDARTGELLWSTPIGAESELDVIRDLQVIDGLIFVNWFDTSFTSIVTALDTDGVERWSKRDAIALPGAVVGGLNQSPDNPFERLDTDGTVLRSIILGQAVPTEPQFAVRDGAATSWYAFPGLERLAGPVELDIADDDLDATSAATSDHIFTLDDGTLRFLDLDGVEVATLEIGRSGRLWPIDGAEPTVLVGELEQPDTGRIKAGDSVTAYRLTGDAIVETWTRPGRARIVEAQQSRPYVVVSESVGEGDDREVVADAVSGEIIVVNNLFREAGANGFVVVEAGDDRELVNIAHDLAGKERWRIATGDRRGIEIVDRGVLAASTDTVAGTVELTFLD